MGEALEIKTYNMSLEQPQRALSRWEKVEEVIECYRELEGFWSYPKECFKIEKWKVNQDYAWREELIKM